MATSALSGKGGVVTGATATEVTEWTADTTGTLLDATSMDSGGFQEWIIGLASSEGTFTAIGLPEPTGSVSLTLQVGATAGDLILSGTALVETTSTSTPVDGRVEYSSTFKYTGSFTVGVVV